MAGYAEWGAKGLFLSDHSKVPQRHTAHTVAEDVFMVFTSSIPLEDCTRCGEAAVIVKSDARLLWHGYDEAEAWAAFRKAEAELLAVPA